jgi:hypothetical protein
MNDEDFEQFITLLDAAIASDDPKIQKALKKFVFLIRLNLSDEDCKPGPFTKMMETIDDLQRRVGAVEGLNNTWTQTQPLGPYHGGTSVSPTHWYNNGTSTITTNTTNAVSNITLPTTTTASTTGNITLTGLSSGSSCTGFTTTAGSTTSTTFTMPAYEVDSGSKIKEQIKEKLTLLAKAA